MNYDKTAFIRRVLQNRLTKNKSSIIKQDLNYLIYIRRQDIGTTFLAKIISDCIRKGEMEFYRGFIEECQAYVIGYVSWAGLEIKIYRR